MKINPGQAAPSFTIQDVNGSTVNLSDYKGKKILLTFYRNVGCPICNLRFHEVQQEAADFKAKNLVVLAVYESSAENMRTYLEGENTPYAVMLPNPAKNLYELYGIEKNKGKAFKSIFHGAIGKAKQGSKLFKTKMKQDGDAGTLGADFLIDENGIVQKAYYSNYIGDHLPLDTVKAFLK